MNHLGMIVIDLVVEDLLAGVDDAAAAGEHPVDPLARVVPEREPDLAPLAVGPAEGVGVEGPVLAGRAEQEVDLVGLEQPRGQQRAVAVVAHDLVGRQRTRSHAGLRMWGE